MIQITIVGLFVIVLVFLICLMLIWYFSIKNTALKKSANQCEQELSDSKDKYEQNIADLDKQLKTAEKKIKKQKIRQKNQKKKQGPDCNNSKSLKTRQQKSNCLRKVFGNKSDEEWRKQQVQIFGKIVDPSSKKEMEKETKKPDTSESFQSNWNQPVYYNLSRLHLFNV